MTFYRVELCLTVQSSYLLNYKCMYPIQWWFVGWIGGGGRAKS